MYVAKCKDGFAVYGRLKDDLESYHWQLSQVYDTGEEALRAFFLNYSRPIYIKRLDGGTDVWV